MLPPHTSYRSTRPYELGHDARHTRKRGPVECDKHATLVETPNQYYE